MFGSSFGFGFTLGQVVTQITGLLGNPLIAGLIVAALAIAWSGRLVRFVQTVGRGGGAGENGTDDIPQYQYDQYARHSAGMLRRSRRSAKGAEMRAARKPSAVQKSIRRHERKEDQRFDSYLKKNF